MPPKIAAVERAPSRFVHDMLSRPNLLQAAVQQQFMFQLNGIR
jgi:hypothetical protein